MESIVPILGVYFFIDYIANRLNKKEDETFIDQHDEAVAGMYGSQNNEENIK